MQGYFGLWKNVRGKLFLLKISSKNCAMIVRTDKLFLKDYRAVKKNKTLTAKLEALTLTLQKIKSIDELQGLKQLKGASFRYRLRLGDYRLGFRLEAGEIVLERFLHRREIYRYYPPK